MSKVNETKERPIAEWETRGHKNDFTWVECSNCGFLIENYKAVVLGNHSTDVVGYKWNACPKCGAMMKFKKEAKEEPVIEDKKVGDTMSKNASMSESLCEVPETLTWCRQHYVPPVKEHIHCPDFGHSDGMNGSCWWCMEMTPYQWHMCKDETWVRGLLGPTSRVRFKCKTRDDAVQFIEEYKQKHPMGNERRALASEGD